jgi:hypothetical protein
MKLKQIECEDYIRLFPAPWLEITIWKPGAIDDCAKIHFNPLNKLSVDEAHLFGLAMVTAAEIAKKL